ncbi:Hypothetical protein AA314_02836 [Archangium gephyra]|uniref:Uncharacterized protein n=1 Tax=Archangium gephyra TaxID=48 RepID=A0AAC8Q520_9BACT|nr:Hypothetical protein AA314_02836 [Archangium gephyra]
MDLQAAQQAFQGRVTHPPGGGGLRSGSGCGGHASPRERPSPGT